MQNAQCRSTTKTRIRHTILGIFSPPQTAPYLLPHWTICKCHVLKPRQSGWHHVTTFVKEPLGKYGDKYHVCWDQHDNGLCVYGCLSQYLFSYFSFSQSLTCDAASNPQKEMFLNKTLNYHMLISPPSLFFFPTDQNKVRADVVLPTFLRRNSFTPLSSEDQIKRPRLYSMGNLPLARTSHPPTLPSMQFSEAFEGAELQSEVSALNITA